MPRAYDRWFISFRYHRHLRGRFFRHPMSECKTRRGVTVCCFRQEHNLVNDCLNQSPQLQLIINQRLPQLN